MLCLSRRVRESIRIGEDIRITVVSISPDRVRLGITAPRKVSVDREEIFLRKRAIKPEPTSP